jgi:hypothetical protein
LTHINAATCSLVKLVNMMQNLVIFALCLAVFSSPATAEVLYVRPDGGPPAAEYRWHDEIIRNPISVKAAIEIAKTAKGSRPIEIRLLRRTGTDETIYSVDLSTYRSALRWTGSPGSMLTFRGQVDRSGEFPRASTILVGQPLRQTICKLGTVDLCYPPPDKTAARDGERHQELADEVASEMERREVARPDASDIRFRLHCFLLWESSYIEFVEMGFRDCWYAAVASYSSTNITLRDTVIEGSTWGFLAVGRRNSPQTAHSFEVTGNFWKQSPSSYRQSASSCDIRNDWDCPASVYADIPWGVSHHHFWSPLNGALFRSKDILGNVKFANNYVYDAYNGIRATISPSCRQNPECRDRTNLGFEITGNVFKNIRDNPIEPEGRAAYWIVKKNMFINVHAAVSTDGVSGHDVLIFGNIFALVGVPGSTCRDEGWVGSRQFLARRGGGKWSADTAQGDEAECGTHRFGTAVKLGGDDDEPLLERVLFFNNSLLTRSPLFRGSPGPPITSYNNAVTFIGCGPDGDISCKQVFDCPESALWTEDRQALFADCFPRRDSKGKALDHRMRFNAYDRLLDAKATEVDQEQVKGPISFEGTIPSGMANAAEVEKIFAIGPDSPLARSGCQLHYAKGDLTCTGTGAPVGAFLPDGKRFDLALPFGYPFTEVLERVVGKGGP